jgi:hypothetical protein
LHISTDLSEVKRPAYLSTRKEEFEFIMKVWGDVFSENDGAFRTWTKTENSSWTPSKQISLPLWDLMYPALADLRRKYPKAHMYTKCKQELQEATQRLFGDDGQTLSRRSAKKFLEEKAGIEVALTSVMSQANPYKGPRGFPDSDNLRKRRYDAQSGKCRLCGQSLDPKRILDGAYAVLDHVLPYSKGGKSVEENAALVHAECNLHKGDKTEKASIGTVTCDRGELRAH